MDPRSRAGYSLIPSGDVQQNGQQPQPGNDLGAAAAPWPQAQATQMPPQGFAGQQGSAGQQGFPGQQFVPNGAGQQFVPNGAAAPAFDPWAGYPPLDPFQARVKSKEWVSAKAMRILQHRSAGFSFIDCSSVYAAALALPQLARSSGWSISYTGLAARGVLFTLVNAMIQVFLLYMICKEERILNKFGRQMYLCNYASHMSDCPDGPNCIGPGGTRFTAERLYDWEMWAVRTYVRDALLALFPDKAPEIQEKVDPGEYGVESFYLRLVCCFLFVLGLWGDLAGSWEMADLIWTLPTNSDRWILPVESSELSQAQPAETAANEAQRAQQVPPRLQAPEEEESTELDFVKFRYAGMPCHWKLFNLFCVLIPKLYIWLLTIDIGVVFLMETSQIEDMIINCVALGFVLNIDELLMSILPPEVSAILHKLEPYPKSGRPKLHLPEEEEIFKHEEGRSWNLLSPALYAALFPRRLIAMLATTSFFVTKYYIERCTYMADGSLVSKPVYLPIEDYLPWISFMFGPFPMIFPIKAQDSPAWVMPEVHG